MVPIELQEHILSYIDSHDKIYASTTCTLWAKILKDMYIKTNNIIKKCAYDVSMFLKQIGDDNEVKVCANKYMWDFVKTDKTICSIMREGMDINILNLLTSLCIEKKYFCYYQEYNLLLNFCEFQCSINKYVKYLIKNIWKSDYWGSNLFVNMALGHKSFALAKYFIIIGGNVEEYIKNIK